MLTEALTGGALARGLGTASSIRWPLRRSSELFELRYGKALVESSRRPGGVPVYGTNGRTGEHDVALFTGPGVIIGRKGAGHLGVHWTESDFWVIDTAYSLVPLEEVDLKFAYYLINHVGLNHLKHGTSNPSLTREAFAAQYFPVPPIEVQGNIAATLGALDDKIESNRRTVALAERLLDALAVAAAGVLPRVPLGEVAEITKQNVTPTTLGTQVVAHFSLPAFDSGARPERCAASTIMSNKLVVPDQSVLVSRLNPRINRTWWAVPPDGIPALASTEFAVLTPTPQADAAAVWLAARDPFFRDELPRRVTGTSGSHQRVRPADLLSIEVPDVRQLDADTRSTASALLEIVHHKREESSQLASLRDALLPELLSGRIRVTEAA